MEWNFAAHLTKIPLILHHEDALDSTGKSINSRLRLLLRRFLLRKKS
jgi:hypothetical protein